MISEKMEAALNEQINKELYSAYLYLAMSAQAEALGLRGTAHWFRAQADEEVEHAMKFFKHLCDRGARVRLQAIEQPPLEFASVQAMFEQTLEHERGVTARIHKLLDQAIAENDHATAVFLQWFVNEQVEEESQVCEILDQLRLAGPAAVLMVDVRLGERKAD